MIEKLLDEPYWDELEGLLKQLAVRIGRSEEAFWLTNEGVKSRHKIISEIMHCLVIKAINPATGQYKVSLKEVMAIIYETQRSIQSIPMTQMEVVKEILLIMLYVRLHPGSWNQEAYDSFYKTHNTNNLQELYLKLISQQ